MELRFFVNLILYGDFSVYKISDYKIYKVSDDPVL